MTMEIQSQILNWASNTHCVKLHILVFGVDIFYVIYNVRVQSFP